MRTLTDFCGIKVDIPHLAEGIYKLILDHPDSACIAIGMIPASIMNDLEKGLKRRIPDCYHLGDVEGIDGKDIRSQIMHAVHSKILDLASKDGTLLV